MSFRSSLFVIFALSATAAFAADPAPAPAPAPAQAPAQQGLPPGHPPIDQMAMPEANHAGLVEEVIPAKPYVYLRVKEGKDAKEDQWLAAPEIDVKAGAQVRWADGMLMNNFQSKTLNRTFEKVLFVMKVEPVAAK